jgi:hypothetical protein
MVPTVPWREFRERRTGFRELRDTTRQGVASSLRCHTGASGTSGSPFGADLAAALDDLHLLRVAYARATTWPSVASAEARTCAAVAAPLTACPALTCLASTVAVTWSGNPASRQRLACSLTRVTICFGGRRSGQMTDDELLPGQGAGRTGAGCGRVR